MTIYEKRQALKHKRALLRDKGICIVCQKNKAGLNNDGTQSVRCNECRDKMTARKFRDRKPIQRVYDPDYDYREQRDFMNYQAAVALIVTDKGNTRGVCTADIHRMLAKAKITPRPEWTLDCIGMLAHIEETTVQPVRYRVQREPRRLELPSDNYRDFGYIYPHRERGVYTERD